MHGAALQFGSGGPVNLPGPPTPVKIPPSHFAPEVKFSPQGYASECRALKRAATCGGVPTKMTPMKRLKIDVAYLTRALEEERARRGKAEAALSKIYYNRRESAHFRAAASKRHLPC